MTSRRPCWCPITIKRRPCWCVPNQSCGRWTLFLCKRISACLITTIPLRSISPAQALYQPSEAYAAIARSAKCRVRLAWIIQRLSRRLDNICLSGSNPFIGQSPQWYESIWYVQLHCWVFTDLLLCLSSKTSINRKPHHPLISFFLKLNSSFLHA